MPPACAIFGAWIAFAIFSSRCLYADGSHEFIRVLEAHDFISLMWSRWRPQPRPYMGTFLSSYQRDMLMEFRQAGEFS